MTTARAPRVAIVGVRRVRTGLGQFFAKHLVAAGAEVPAFIASRKETIEEGRWSLRNVGVDAEGFVDLDALLDAHPVDALVVASPHATHARGWSRDRLRLHVLCEPLVGETRRLTRAMNVVELVTTGEARSVRELSVAYALPTFDALHPTARRGDVRSFEMEMAPSSSGPSMLVDDKPSLSVLQEFVPRGEAHPGAGGRALVTDRTVVRGRAPSIRSDAPSAPPSRSTAPDGDHRERSPRRPPHPRRDLSSR